MPNNNTTLTGVAALILAILSFLTGAVLLFVGKISYDNSVFFFISALGLFGFHSAWNAPSPAQQSQLLNLVAQNTAPQPPAVINNYVPAPAQQIPMQPGNTYPYPAAQVPIESLSTQTSLQAVRSNAPAEGG